MCIIPILLFVYRKIILPYLMPWFARMGLIKPAEDEQITEKLTCTGKCPIMSPKTEATQDGQENAENELKCPHSNQESKKSI